MCLLGEKIHQFRIANLFNRIILINNKSNYLIVINVYSLLSNGLLIKFLLDLFINWIEPTVLYKACVLWNGFVK